MSGGRALVRRMVPLSLRQSFSAARRRWSDARAGVSFADARIAQADLSTYTVLVEIIQPVQPGTLFENKLINLACGAARINLAMLSPGQTCSFWQYVRRPLARNGFVEGRNLVNQQLTRQLGGGLCQLSSLMYHLALVAGLEIVERHAHSIDIYQEQERFTPLGADATVVWGYKDLRLKNSGAGTLVLACHLQQHTLVGRVYSSMPLPSRAVAFIREPMQPPLVLVRTMVDGQLHTRTEYVQKQGMPLQQRG